MGCAEIWLLSASVAEPGDAAPGPGASRRGGWNPQAAARSSCPELGARACLWEGSRRWAGGAELHPGVPGELRGDFTAGTEARVQLGASVTLRRSLPAPQKRVSRASTLASGRRRMDLSAQPPPSSSSQKGNGLKMWQLLIIT